MIPVAIIGGAGYTGGELIRILLNHPFVELSAVVSESQAGKLVSSIHTDLVGDTDLVFSSALNGMPEVIFLCTGHGKAKRVSSQDYPGQKNAHYRPEYGL